MDHNSGQYEMESLSCCSMHFQRLLICLVTTVRWIFRFCGKRLRASLWLLSNVLLQGHRCYLCVNTICACIFSVILSRPIRFQNFLFQSQIMSVGSLPTAAANQLPHSSLLPSTERRLWLKRSCQTGYQGVISYPCTHIDSHSFVILWPGN